MICVFKLIWNFFKFFVVQGTNVKQILAKLSYTMLK